MPDADHVMLLYVELANLSRDKRQWAGRDRFLVLAGAAACQAGFLDVAERCRELVLEHNSHHLVGRYPSFPEALRSEEFPPFLRQLERFCSPERAEHLLQELNVSLIPGETPAGEQALERLT